MVRVCFLGAAEAEEDLLCMMDLERAQSSVSPVSPQPGPPDTPTESSKHDHLISEVETTEGQLGPILRYVSTSVPTRTHTHSTPL